MHLRQRSVDGNGKVGGGGGGHQFFSYVVTGGKLPICFAYEQAGKIYSTESFSGLIAFDINRQRAFAIALAFSLNQI